MIQEKLGKLSDLPANLGVKGRVREDGRSDPDSCHPRKASKDRERLPRGSLLSGQGLASTYRLPSVLVWEEQPSVLVWEKTSELCTQSHGSEATLPVGGRCLGHIFGVSVGTFSGRCLGHIFGVPVLTVRPDLQTDRVD